MIRRDFIKIVATCTGALLTGWHGGLLARDARRAASGELKPNFYLALHPTGEIEFFLTKLEMGQGVGTGYQMIIAEELEVMPQAITVRQANYDHQSHDGVLDINGGTTGGSRSIRLGWQKLRMAAASARTLLIQAAADEWQVPISECYAKQGAVLHDASGRRLGYETLIPKAAQLTLAGDVQLKSPSQFTIIGQSMPSRLAPTIAKGELTFGIDLTRPGMQYAAIQRSPYLHGRIHSFNAEKATNMPGVHKILPIDKEMLTAKEQSHEMLATANVRAGVAVIADNSWSAFNGAKALDIQWIDKAPEKYSNDSLRQAYHQALSEPGEPLFQLGDADKQIASAENTFEGIYETPFNTHLYLEPLNAIAEVTGDRCELWVGTQNAHRDAQAVAAALDIPVANIKVNVCNAGGSFGRRFDPDVSVEAALLAAKLNKPVKVLWQREAEIEQGRQGNYELQSFQVSLDSNRMPRAYRWQAVASDPYVWWENHYLLHLAHQNHLLHAQPKVLDTAPWRAVGAARSNLGIECFADELAYVAGMDPLDYRLKLLNEPVNVERLNQQDRGLGDFTQKIRSKMAATLKQLGDISQWQAFSNKPSSNKANNQPTTRGRGLACGHFSGTVAAQLAEVSYIDGKIRLDKITALVDCGIVVNPSLARQQVEGAIIWGLTSVFKSETKFEDNAITQRNFHDTPMMTIDEMPAIEIIFVESNATPTGLGEPAVCGVIPAVMNAVADATGQRHRARPLPFELARRA